MLSADWANDIPTELTANTNAISPHTHLRQHWINPEVLAIYLSKALDDTFLALDKYCLLESQIKGGSADFEKTLPWKKSNETPLNKDF
jgi:hypothetical protein